MALKITAEIGTNRGITNSAYLRIVNYQISKFGYLQLNTQMFLNEEQASVPMGQIVAGMECFNIQIQNMLMIPLTKTLTRTVNKMVMVEEEYEKKTPIYDENGQLTGNFNTETATHSIPKQMDVEEEYQVPDLSLIENQDIFAYGYAALKTKLIQTFGAENII